MAKVLNNIKVENCNSISSYGKVANQFIITITTKKGTKHIFQSYNSVIAVEDEHGNITLDKNKWDYSRTTGKYRNQFLGETTAETRKKIKDGIYKLKDLN